MKKNILKGLVVTMLFVSCIQACKFECHYSRIGKVTKVKGEIVTVVDNETGNIWEFEGDGFSKNDRIKLKFFTNHTDNTVKDDWIVDAVRVD